MTRSSPQRQLTARTADRFSLYEQSVQAPEVEVDFLDKVFRKTRGRRPLSLREDFCGTGALCAAWVISHSERTALGLDLDQPTLDYGKEHHLDALGEAKTRAQLCRRNVLALGSRSVDLIAAFNFSYCVFKTRDVMLRYLTRAHDALEHDGMLALDVYGGTDAHSELTEKKKQRGFTYVWEQGPYDAITGEAERHIHFHFKDGSEIKRAFSYDWRIWSLPELRDILREAGFATVDVYWEGADGKGHGNGVFRKTLSADNEQAWIAYVLAWK